MSADHHHHPCCGVSTDPQDYFLTRRQFLNRTGMGLGALGLASLLDPLNLVAAPADAKTVVANPLAPHAPQFPGKAKAVIHIFAQGAPSHVDTWDPKPMLTKMNNKTIGTEGGVAMGSPFKFQPYGKSGIEVSELFARTAAHVDDMAVIRSMYTDIPAHEVATVFMNTGSLRITKPSLGAWTVYGLGSENQNLPGFISLRTGGLPPGGATNYGSAFLPGSFQGTSVNTQAQNVQQMIQNIRNNYVSKAEQRRQLDFINQLNSLREQNLEKDAALEARLQSYEIAFRMQAEATDVFDINKEPADVRAAYGNSQPGKQLLIARRLIERGVRFVQVWHTGWDHHQDLEDRITTKAGEIDQPLAALMADLKQRGLLDSTLVIWGGEFGRKPTKDKNGGENPGRDHNAKAFSVVMAGGGIKGGIVHGATDEFGAAAVKDKVHVHDLHATILQCMGFDHKKLTYRFNGRDFRLTDVAGEVVKPILA
ncbi:MAG: DUF1501 domain-containing protein [bacterium]|nr:DUF1501 domain-containing protein [bacterium]MDI1336221.1 DUF1501 domain-containing protein [Lacunisphaera sp.]